MQLYLLHRGKSLKRVLLLHLELRQLFPKPPHPRGGGLDLDASKELNLFSAFAHVFADTLRTLTVLTCALLVWVAGVPPETADAVGALIVSGIVLVITLYLAYETFVQLVAFVGGGRKHSTAPRELPTSGDANA